jgi:predicted Zn finger-like uncharacterized protein
MLVICSNCSTSYMLDPATVGPAGRTVRCARCQTTWFVNPPDPVEAFVDGVLAEAEAEVAREQPPVPAVPALSTGVPVHARDLDDPHHPETCAPPPDSLEPIAYVESPPLMPEPEVRAPAREETAENVESFAERRRKIVAKRQKARRSSRWTAAVLVLFAFNVAVIGARQDVVRYLPQTASLFSAVGLPVNLRQLAFENVRVNKESEDGATVVSIDGKIVSKSSKPVQVPRLRFAARNEQGREIYTWTARPERSTLGAGETLEFHSFAKPPAEAADVIVRFFTAQDAAAGL